MNLDKPLHLTIEVKTSDGTPLQIGSIKINDQEFLPKEKAEPANSESNRNSVHPAPEPVLATVALTTPSSLEPEPVIKPQPVESSSGNVLTPTDEFNTLEEFGGNSFYRTFWGDLTYQPIDAQTSLVTYQGSQDVFDLTFVGKWLEPSRIHKCSADFPIQGRNYFPSALAVVYSRVLEVRDGKSLIVDFPYNGGSTAGPKSSTNQDGTFFFDNKFAIESWGASSQRKPLLMANSGQVFACLGIPKIPIGPDSQLNFKQVGSGERPAIHLMLSDGFNGDEHGTGVGISDSFKETFGENSKLFDLPGHGRVDIDFDWQLIPPTYAQKVVQYGVPQGVIFFDGATLSTQYGLKRFSNFDQFRIKNEMTKALGFTRPGVTCSMPNQGYCNGGGIHDGSDVKEFCTYRFEGDWYSKDPNNMKARTSGGLKLEWIGKSKESPGRFIELESQKAYLFENLNMKFISNEEVEVDNPDFTWYHLACQEWTGGVSTDYEFTYIEFEGRKIWLNSNGDFWLIYGDGDLKCRSFGSRRARLFDKIPVPGDLIKRDTQTLRNCGIIGKISDVSFEIWGWAIQPGDQLSFAGSLFTVVSTDRKWKTWEQFAADNSLSSPRLKRSDRKINYTLVTLDKQVSGTLDSIEFKVEKSAFQSFIGGQFRGGCKAGWGFGNDAPGHLMYIDYNVNLIFKNIDIRGLIRSTSRPLWAETTGPNSGRVNSISVSALGSKIWNKGDKLWLAHPESGKKQQVEVAENFDGNRGEVRILPVDLSYEFPQNSILVGLFSLASEARFEHVNFVNEDLTPSYSDRIDYRPQGLRMRQLLTGDSTKRVIIKGGRISWYSTIDNRFEPEVEFSEKPFLVNTKSVIPVLLNPIIADKNGLSIGLQRKETGKKELFFAYRIVVSKGEKLDLSNVEMGADLYVEGNGEMVLDQLNSRSFTENNKSSGVGFNLIVQDKYSTTESLSLRGKNGKVGLMVSSPYPVGVLKIDFQNWELKPGLFNDGGFQTVQDQSDPRYKEFIKISN